MYYRLIICGAFLLECICWQGPVSAETSAEESFYPTWKLLSIQERQQFVAGYLFGWKDAAKVTDVVLDYVKENPTKAVEGLEKAKSLYSVQALRPAEIAREVDLFFQASENKEASLSRAMSFARGRLQ